MRQKLNENPVAQFAIIAVLAAVAGYFVLTSLGGGEAEEAEVPVAATSESTATPEEGVTTETGTVGNQRAVAPRGAVQTGR